MRLVLRRLNYVPLPHEQRYVKWKLLSSAAGSSPVVGETQAVAVHANGAVWNAPFGLAACLFAAAAVSVAATASGECGGAVAAVAAAAGGAAAECAGALAGVGGGGNGGGGGDKAA